MFSNKFWGGTFLRKSEVREIVILKFFVQKFAKLKGRWAA